MWRDWSIFISNYPTNTSPLGGKSNLVRYWFVTETATGWQSQTLTMTFYCSKCPTSRIREKFGHASAYRNDMYVDENRNRSFKVHISSLIEMKRIRKVLFCFAVKQRNDRGGSLTQGLFALTSYTVACSDLQIFVLCPSFVHFMCPQFWLHQEAFWNHRNGLKLYSFTSHLLLLFQNW